MIDSRRKGHNWERQLVTMFREIMPDANIKRGLQYRDGAEAPDVDMPVFHVEAKVGKKLNIRAALEQAKRDCGRGKIPLAVVKDDRELPFVVIELHDFLEFISEWWARR